MNKDVGPRASPRPRSDDPPKPKYRITGLKNGGEIILVSKVYDEGLPGIASTASVPEKQEDDEVGDPDLIEKRFEISTNVVLNVITLAVAIAALVVAIA